MTYRVSQAQPLHDLVKEWKDAFFENEALQQFLDRKYEDEERYASWIESPGPVWPREFVRFRLEYLQRVRKLATEPQLIVVENEGISSAGQGVVLDVKAGEALQEAWLKHPTVPNLVRAYETQLTAAFEEFNLQHMLGVMRRARVHFPQFPDEQQYANRLERTWDKDAYMELDSAYYDKAKRWVNESNHTAAQLYEDTFGRKFVITQEELIATLNGKP